jgi:BirA family biotin operon repressor/biotin-[acetyl-CoA-carboxylase] ligase
LLSVLLQELAQVLDIFSRAGFASLRADWEAHHAFQDRSIQLQMPDGSTISGIARGVSDSGELLLETPQGIRAFNSGEVGVRQ